MSAKPLKPATKNAALAKPKMKRVPADPLLTDLRQMIAEAREQVARTVNSGLTFLYWHIGTRIRRDLLKEKRAGYGEKIVQAVAAQLAQEFGRGYSRRNLTNMIRFAEAFPDAGIWQALPAKLSWTHLVAIGVDHYLDLLFYHRHLRRLVAMELKLEDFKPGDKGQMELYLGWLNRYERKEGEESPIGLILCAGKRQETIELLNLEQSGIQVSSYWTEALPKAEMERKLHDAVKLARARLKSDAP